MSKTRLSLFGGACALAVFILPLFLRNYGVFLLSTWAVMTIAALGLNLTLGYAGQVSLAQGAFVGVGAYATALLTTHGVPLPLAFAASGLLAFVVGWGLGYPALRVQHHYLAFVTLAFTTLMFLVFRNEEWLTGGVSGIAGIPRPSLFGLSLSEPVAFCYFCLALLAAVSWALLWLVRSPWGRAFVALRENPLRAASLGVDTRRYTLMAFAIGSGLGGLSGSLYAPLVQYIEPASFGLGLSLNLLLMVVVGGQGFFLGPFLGALIAILLPEWLRFTEGFYLMIYALSVIVLMAVSPKGLLGIADNWASRRKTIRASAARAAAQATFKAGDQA